MVLINTQRSEEITFNYFLDIPRCGCTYGSARDSVTGRSRLYLLFQREGGYRIYRRDGLRGTWVEVADDAQRDRIRALYERAVEDAVPRFQANQEVLR